MYIHTYTHMILYNSNIDNTSGNHASSSSYYYYCYYSRWLYRARSTTRTRRCSSARRAARRGPSSSWATGCAWCGRWRTSEHPVFTLPPRNPFELLSFQPFSVSFQDFDISFRIFGFRHNYIALNI